MKKTLLSLLLLCLVLPAFSQKEITDEMIEQKRAEVMALAIRLNNECFPAQSSPAPHPSSYTINGKEVKFTSHETFQRANFQIVSDDMSAKEKKDINLINTDALKKWFNVTNNSFNILAHGVAASETATANKINVGGHEFTAEEFAPVILQQLRKYQIILNMKQEPLTIVLHCCNTGRGDNCFASQLADILGSEIENLRVVAPSDINWFTYDTSSDIIKSERVFTSEEIKRFTREKVTANHVTLSNINDKTDGKNWRVFQKGKKPVEGMKDSNATIDAVNKQFFDRLEKEYKQGKIFLKPSSMN